MAILWDGIILCLYMYKCMYTIHVYIPNIQYVYTGSKFVHSSHKFQIFLIRIFFWYELHLLKTWGKIGCAPCFRLLFGGWMRSKWVRIEITSLGYLPTSHSVACPVKTKTKRSKLVEDWKRAAAEGARGVIVGGRAIEVSIGKSAGSEALPALTRVPQCRQPNEPSRAGRTGFNRPPDSRRGPQSETCVSEKRPKKSKKSNLTSARSTRFRVFTMMYKRFRWLGTKKKMSVRARRLLGNRRV